VGLAGSPQPLDLGLGPTEHLQGRQPGDQIGEVVGALGRSRRGVNFDALDNQPVNLVMLFLVPQGQFQKHLHTLANIAKLLHKAEFRQALDQAADAETMYRIIKEQGKK